MQPGTTQNSGVVLAIGLETGDGCPYVPQLVLGSVSHSLECLQGSSRVPAQTRSIIWVWMWMKFWGRIRRLSSRACPFTAARPLLSLLSSRFCARERCTRSSCSVALHPLVIEKMRCVGRRRCTPQEFQEAMESSESAVPATRSLKLAKVRSLLYHSASPGHVEKTNEDSATQPLQPICCSATHALPCLSELHHSFPVFSSPSLTFVAPPLHLRSTRWPTFPSAGLRPSLRTC